MRHYGHGGWKRVIPFRHLTSLPRRTEPLQITLIAVAFWTLAVVVLINLRSLHLWGMPQVDTVFARVAMVCCVLLLVLVGAWRVIAWRKSGSLAPVRRALGGTPGMLLFAAVASYLAIGTAVLGLEAISQPEMAGRLKYLILQFGVLVAAAIGGCAVLERIGAERLLRGVLVVLICGCAIILASPVLRDFDILPPYRIPFRLTGAFGDPNDASFTACMTVVLAAAFLTNGGPRVLGWLGLAAGVAASLGTASRTAFIALVAMAVVFLWINFRSEPRRFVLVLATTGLVGIAGFFSVLGLSGGFAEWSRLRVDSAAANGESLFCDFWLTGDLDADCSVLLATRDILAGDVVLNWSYDVPVQDWRGVTVEGLEKRVTKLHLQRLGLNGRIPSDLGRLDHLVTLALQRNRLTGRIPPELGNLASLKNLNLNYNGLTGAIPSELAKLKNLKMMRLAHNRLTGPIPVDLGRLDLTTLQLSGNDFDSVLPELTAVDHGLAGKGSCAPMTSPSPALFDDCTLLLEVKDTLAGGVRLNWHAELPVGQWQGVTVGGSPERVIALDLYAKGLNGRIPPELGRLDGLQSLNLAANQLTGPIPPELGRLAGLRDLSLDRNALTGTVPAELGQLNWLESLWLRENRLTGPVAPAVLDIPAHDLGHIKYCRGSPPFVPMLFDDCTLLLEVKNTLAGGVRLNWHADLPVGQWQGVTVGGSPERVIALDLHAKGLNGRIPPELGRLDGLQSLNLAANQLTGPIPPELGRLAGLRDLSLDRNALTGTVPVGLGQLNELESLWLRENRLTGPVAPAVLDIPAHDLGHIRYCRGSPPPVPMLFDDCTLLLAVKETLAGEAELDWSAALPIDEWEGVSVGGDPPRVVALDLKARGLTGSIPPELGRLDGLQSLDLSANQLTGSIPPVLGKTSENILNNRMFCLPPPRISSVLFDDCARLLAMRDALVGNGELNWNVTVPINEWQGVTVGGPEDRVLALELPRMELSGRVPAALGRLAGLRSLVLDGNRLTGAIPPELGELGGLEILGLAANNLTGPIPPELGKLSSLKELWLSDNRLTGSLPPKLRAVAVEDAHCPAVPGDNLGLRFDCALLLEARDILAGTARLNWSEHLPIEFWRGVTIGGSLKRVTKLELPRSGLNGRIPPALGRLSQLVSLDLSYNRLTGLVPPELGEAANLERLTLSFNALSGPIPAKLEGLKKLALLHFSGNDTGRSFPRRLAGIAGETETAEAAHRPASLDRPQEVRRLFCRPSSGIASELRADCALLLANKDVLAGDASLNWSEDIPIEFWQGITTRGSPRRVTALELPGRGLNGHLFAELGELDDLVSVNLGNNRLAGPIPPELGELERLVSLRLEGNRLTGLVPSELEGLDNLLFLYLAGNDLEWPFSPVLHEIINNDLDTPVFCRPGKIDPGLLADCALLLAARDVLAGTAPLNWREEVPVDDWLGVTADRSRGRVTALDLTQMGLNGRIPSALGRLAELVSLRLGRNRLAGDIPPELGNLADLRMLALDGNLLSGSVPPELGKLSRLTDLWLQGNRLTARVPPSVVALPELTVLRLRDDEVAAEPALDPARSGFSGRNLFCRPSFAAMSRLHGDCAALLAARDVLAGDVELNWREEVPISHWRGVTVGFSALAGGTADGLRVVALDLSHTGLNGRIPAELSALDGLAVLRLGHNRLAGSIPSELGALSGLRHLTLENNALTGPIPKELGALRELVSLRLGNNELTGLTRQFATLTNLRVLALENNALTGKIVWQIGNLWRLEELRLDNNRLRDMFPEQLDWLTRLAILRLGGNAFADCISDTARVAQVRDNDLDSADLLCDGSPWAKLGLFEDGAHLMRLRDILAGDAVLNWSYTRPIASWQGVYITSYGRVGLLDLRNMNLTGRLPAELGELNHLYVLLLDDNRLTGPVPPELMKLPRLNILSLENNNLTGPILPENGELRNISQLWVSGNQFTGSIPPEWAKNPRLSLAISGNDIQYRWSWMLDGLFSHDVGAVHAILAMDRPLLWRLGFEKALEAPVFGHGLGALEYMDNSPVGHHGRPLGPHNLYLTLLGEAGVVPLLLFVAAIVLLLRALRGVPKSLSRDVIVVGGTVIVLYGMTFQHLLSIGAFMFFAGLSVALAAARNDDRHLAKA